MSGNNRKITGFILISLILALILCAGACDKKAINSTESVYAATAGNADITTAEPAGGVNAKSAEPADSENATSAAHELNVDGNVPELNVFPLKYKKKYGFVDGEGEVVVEPIYDDVRAMNVYEGADNLSYAGDYPYPAYYFAAIYKKDESGAIEIYKDKYGNIHMELLEYVAVIGPSGKIMYETHQDDVMISSINLTDNSLCGYSGKEDRRQFFIFDGEKEFKLPQNEYMTEEIYYQNCRIYDPAGKNLIVNLTGVFLSDTQYNNLAAYNDDCMIFQKDGKLDQATFSRMGGLTAVDNAGNETYALPDEIDSIIWLGYANVYIYTTREKPKESGDFPGYLYGFMNREFKKITEPKFHMILPMKSGRFLIASNNEYDDDGNHDAFIIDLKGNRITKDTYNNIKDTNYFPGSFHTFIDGENTGQTEYFIGQKYNKKDGDPRFDSYIIDERGNVIVADTETLKIVDVYRNYVIVIVAGPLQGRSGNMGIKKIPEAKKEVSTWESEWAVPPNFLTYLHEKESRYITLKGLSNESSELRFERITVFDVLTGKALFEGDFQTLYFAGYKYVGIDSGFNSNVGAAGIFYAETATKIGYLNDLGEWIASVSLDE